MSGVNPPETKPPRLSRGGGLSLAHSSLVRPPGLSFTSRLAVARLGLGTASHPHQLMRVPLRRSNRKTPGVFLWASFASLCPPTRIRTWDHLVKSELLYQLSYGRK